MLNYPNAQQFFENCLRESGLLDGRSPGLSLNEVRADLVAKKTLVRTLRDIQTGADAVLARGKPAEDTLGLSLAEWERRWSAWAASRKAAFFTRAALLLLGERAQLAYFINTLKTSHNLVFLGASSDVLQHATGHYLNGPEEDLPNAALARRWEQLLERQS